MRAHLVGVDVQTAAFTAGACCDASLVYEVGAAPRVAVIGHPRENSHGFEVVRLSVFDNVMKRWWRGFCKRWSGGRGMCEEEAEFLR